jgi:predicted MFS family arabinose efflux permease
MSFGKQSVLSGRHQTSVAVVAAVEGGATAGPAASIEPDSVVWAIWPLLLAAFVCTLPYPAANIFVGSLATDFGVGAAVIGGMRGLGGGAALLVGFAAAPLLDRFPRAWTICLGLAIVAGACLLPIIGDVMALGGSFFAVGAAIAIVMPAVQAACGDLFHGPEAGRAASLVNAAQGLSNVLAGPILSLPALLAGWHGVYVGIAVAASLTAAFVAPRLSWRRPVGVSQAGYREAFARVARAPGAVALLIVSTLRACTQMAWLAFLAAAFADRFQADAVMISVVWVFGAGAFFVANVLAGRLVNAHPDAPRQRWRSAEGWLLASTVLSVATVPLAYIAPTLLLALLGNLAYACAVGTSMAALVSVLMRRYASLRGSVMSLNMAGNNAGTVIGTGIAGVGLGLGGYDGLALTLVALSLLAVVALMVARRALASAPAVASDDSLACPI